MGIINPFSKKNAPALGIAEMAERDNIKRQAERIAILAKEISDILINEFWKADIKIGEYMALKNAIVAECDSWFNKEINGRKMQSIITNPDPRPEAQIDQEKQQEGESDEDYNERLLKATTPPEHAQ